MGVAAYITIAIVGTLLIVAITVPLGYFLLKRAVRAGTQQSETNENT